MSSRLLLLMRRRAGGPVGLLDNYTANLGIAYSMRQLLSSYSGPLIRVREDSGDTEADIGFDTNGNLDTAALLAHTGANSGYIAKWYDQSGNTRHITEATAGRQPRIVNSGTVDVGADGLPGMVFDGTDDSLVLTWTPNVASASLFSVITTSDDSYLLLGGENTATYLGVCQDGSGTTPQNASGTPAYYKNTNVISTATRDGLHTAFSTGSRVIAEARSCDLTASGWSKIEPMTYDEGTSTIHYSGQLHEFILYTAGGSEAAVETAINAYWGIY